MPNWCYNKVTLTHENPDKVDELRIWLTEREQQEDPEYNLFNHLYPRPKSEDDNWYDWNVTHWGTKWDVSMLDFWTEDGAIIITYDTAWSPPLAFYSHLEDAHGFNVVAYYHEEGMTFCGKYEDGSEETYDYGEWIGNLDELQENVPEDIYEYANLEGIHEMHMEYLAEEEAAQEEADLADNIQKEVDAYDDENLSERSDKERQDDVDLEVDLENLRKVFDELIAEEAESKKKPAKKKAAKKKAVKKAAKKPAKKKAVKKPAKKVAKKPVKKAAKKPVKKAKK